MSDTLPAWSRPPFEPGNELAVTHGAYSVRHVGPVADQLLQAVLQDAGVSYLHSPAYRPAVTAWAEAEARVILIQAWVDGMSTQSAAESDRGKTSPLELLRKWEASASSHRARLGLDPLSRARLGRDVAAAQVDAVKLLTADRAEAEASRVE